MVYKPRLILRVRLSVLVEVGLLVQGCEEGIEIEADGGGFGRHVGGFGGL